MTPSRVKKRISWVPLSPMKSALMLIFIFGFLAIASLAAPVSAPLWIVLAAAIIALILINSPLSLSLTPQALTLRTPLRRKVFPIAEIEGIESLNGRTDISPMMGMNGICGYTGFVNLDGHTPKCICYYGNYQECFLLTMKNGRRYILGCDDHRTIVESVNNLIGATPKSQVQ